MLELLLGAVTLGLAAAVDQRRPVPPSSLVAPGRKTENGLLLRPAWEWCRCCPGSVHVVDEIYGAQFIPPGMGLGWLFMSPKDKRMVFESYLKSAIPWNESITYDPEWVEISTTYDYDDELYYDVDGDAYEEEPEPYWKNSTLILQGKTWPEFNLFPDKKIFMKPEGGFIDPIYSYLAGKVPNADDYVSRSPSGRWQYVNRVLRRGETLPIHKYDEWENELVEGGQVVFDSDVVIPVIFENGQVWMSNTPFEALSQKEAADTVSGKVIIGGLGLGWVLSRVANNPNVTEVVVVEINQELVDWLMPQLCSRLPKDKPIHVVVGDVYTVMPKLEADYALIDIWPTYTGIDEDMQRLIETGKPNIGKWWGWGNDWGYGTFQRGYRRYKTS